MTLRGKIKVSVTIRNSIQKGSIEVKTLKLERKDENSKWSIPKAELKRISDQFLKPETK